MKWSASVTLCIASLGSIASALPALLNDPANLIPASENHTENGIAARSNIYCTPAHTAPINAVGGQGGASFCGSKWPGPILPKTLTTYSSGNSITGIEQAYTDGTTDRWGNGFNTKPSGSITLAPGELITSAWLAGNGIGTRLGKIHLVTNKGQTVELGTSNAPNTYKTDVGSGLWVGITGNFGSDIDNLALLFVKPKITGINVGNMNIDPGQLSNAQGQHATAAFTDQVHYFNDGTAGNQTFTFQNSRKVTQSTTVSQSTTGTIGQSIGFSVEFAIPEIVKLTVSNTITWSVAHTTGTDTTDAQEYTAQYMQGGTLAPQTGVDCSAIIWKGQGTFSYSSTVSYSFDDGTSFSYPENGKMTTEQFTQGESICKPTTANITPVNFAVGKTVKQT